MLCYQVLNEWEETFLIMASNILNAFKKSPSALRGFSSYHSKESTCASAVRKSPPEEPVNTFYHTPSAGCLFSNTLLLIVPRVI